METMAVEKSWFAVLNDQDIVEEVLQMPSSVSGAEFIVIPAEDQSLVGKRYNRETGEFETAVYYYAELDEKGIVVEIISSPTPVVKDNWIQIPSDDKTLIGMWYDKENKQFIDPPAFVIAAHSTDEICYKQEDKWLSKKLDEMEQVIAAVEKQEGPKGEQGDTGPVGPQGAKGDVGAMGPQGLVGPQGAKGDTGAQGLKGDAGAQGLQGLKGDKGDAGLPGAKGDRGDTGAIGPQGAKGATGATGAQGVQGVKGDKGDAGLPGAKGDKGDTGAIGPQGTKGATGAAGPQGLQGVKGDKGDAGAIGPQGAKGATGATGSQGPAGLATAAGNVAVLTGNFNAGYSDTYTAPLPAGYTEAQCKFLVGGSASRTVRRYVGNQNPGEFTGTYLVIGIK